MITLELIDRRDGLSHASGILPDNMEIIRSHPLGSFPRLVSILCQNLNVLKQLGELKVLQDGWLDGEGLAPPVQGLDWLSRAFDQHFPWNLRPPHIYPTVPGGIQAEWSLGSNEVTLKINLETHIGEWHELDLETDAVYERTLNCDAPSHWNWLASRLQAMDPEDA